MNESSPTIESVYVEYDQRDERTHEAYELLTKSLARIGIEQTVQVEDAGAMIVIGGDGTLIQAIHKHEFPGLPIRGINTGTIGFFMSSDPTVQEIDDLTLNFTTGNYTIDKLSVLDVKDSQNRRLGRALNEAALRSSSGQALHMNLQIGSADFGKLTGDGVIVSTPSGSTGYAKSAGGPFMHEALRAYEVVPLNPYYSPIDRPAIVPGDLPSRVIVTDVARRPFQLSLDGKVIKDTGLEQQPSEEEAYEFTISPDVTVNMVRFDGHEYFKKLGQKIREIREHHS